MNTNSDNILAFRATDALNEALKSLYSAETRKGIEEPTMSEVDAKIAAAEARTDTKFAELLGELKLLNQRMEHVERSTSGMRSTVVGTGIGVVAVVIAVMAYGAQWFGLGMDAQQVAERAVQSSTQNLQPQINSLTTSNVELNAKMDALIRGLNDRMMESGGQQPAPFQDPRK